MRALVVGAGRMGTFHRRVLRDLGFDVTTVDPAPGRADHRNVPPGCFDVVCVAVPIPYLAEEAARWVGHGGHLFIEKPMAATSNDAIELAALLEGQRVAVGYVERFNPQLRRLAERLAVLPAPLWAKFVRWGDRYSPDVALDLRAHDVDLVRHLDLQCQVEFTCVAERMVKRRIILIRCPGQTLRTDLLAHSASPLHAQWHAFLGNGAGCATPADAIATLLTLEQSPVAA